MVGATVAAMEMVEAMQEAGAAVARPEGQEMATAGATATLTADVVAGLEVLATVAGTETVVEMPAAEAKAAEVAMPAIRGMLAATGMATAAAKATLTLGVLVAA